MYIGQPRISNHSDTTIISLYLIRSPAHYNTTRAETLLPQTISGNKMDDAEFAEAFAASANLRVINVFIIIIIIFVFFCFFIYFFYYYYYYYYYF